ncbi:epithelial membrane protein 1-like [Physella acuta]|uniref:epithelial membrane protein 1-like n=1 Tax=Physella acuta TaxID=109671 RepID=UPI0027DCD063|nr:epithelial membrane protein 1-like [Physella acuta]
MRVVVQDIASYHWMSVQVGAIVAIVLLFVGAVLHIVGLATPEWSVAKVGGGSFGLWEVCSELACVKYADLPGLVTIPDSIKACEAMAIIGMLISFVALAAAGIDLFHKISGKDASAPFRLISTATSIISFVFILIGIIIWGTKEYEPASAVANIGYSFIQSIIGGITIAIGGIIFGLTS